MSRYGNIASKEIKLTKSKTLIKYLDTVVAQLKVENNAQGDKVLKANISVNPCAPVKKPK